MQTKIDGEKVKTIKDISVSIPKNIYSSKISALECETGNIYTTMNTQGSLIFKALHRQHPLISTWLVLSSVSICFLSALLFIMH